MATFFFTEKQFEGKFDVSDWHFNLSAHRPISDDITSALNESLPDRMFLDVVCVEGQGGEDTTLDVTYSAPCSFKVGFYDCFDGGECQTWSVNFDDFANHFSHNDYDIEEYLLIASELRRLADKFDEKAKAI